LVDYEVLPPDRFSWFLGGLEHVLKVGAHHPFNESIALVSVSTARIFIGVRGHQNLQSAQPRRATHKTGEGDLLFHHTQQNGSQGCSTGTGHTRVIAAKGENDNAFARLAHLREGISERLAEDLPIANQSWRRLGQIATITG
jgi:hypothetical protein